MDVTRAIQVGVAWADLIICRMLAFPWKRIGLSVAIAILVMHVVRSARKERGGVS